MSNGLENYESRDLTAEETGWVRELARGAGLGDGDMFAIAVHLPGKPKDTLPVPVFDLFLDPLPERDVLVRRRPSESE
jgi:hypothetical protein